MLTTSIALSSQRPPTMIAAQPARRASGETAGPRDTVLTPTTTSTTGRTSQSSENTAGTTTPNSSRAPTMTAAPPSSQVARDGPVSSSLGEGSPADGQPGI